MYWCVLIALMSSGVQIIHLTRWIPPKAKELRANIEYFACYGILHTDNDLLSLSRRFLCSLQLTFLHSLPVPSVCLESNRHIHHGK